jgi:phage gpG-like protein
LGSYKKSKYKKRGGAQKILYKEGTLQESLGYTANNSSVTVGINAKSGGFPYGATHQFGSKKLNIPARAFLPIDENANMPDSVKKQVLEILQDHIEKSLR